jgi:hypothetical protein
MMIDLSLTMINLLLIIFTDLLLNTTLSLYSLILVTLIILEKTNKSHYIINTICAELVRIE